MKSILALIYTFIHICIGIYYPKGGFGRVAQALESIAIESGVDLRLNCTVNTIQIDPTTTSISSITYTQPSTSTNCAGKVESGSILASKYITNIDAPEFETQYLSESNSAVSYTDRRTASGRPSCGIVSIHFALNTTLQALSHHTLYLSKHYRSSWATVEQPDSARFSADSFNFYVHAPSRTDPTVCPIGHDAITVLVPVPPLPVRTDTTATSGGDSMNSDRIVPLSEAEIAVIREAVLSRLDEMELKYCTASTSTTSTDDTHTSSSSSGSNIIPYKDIRKHIVHEHIVTPIQWHDNYSLYRGSAFGLAHQLTQLSVLRPRLRSVIYTPLTRTLCIRIYGILIHAYMVYSYHV